MALKLLQLQLQFQFPIFSPHPIQNPNLSFTPNHHRQETEIRFARWNNANARSFNERRRAQQEIEDDIRRTRRFTAADNLANDGDDAPPSPTTTNTPYFKSVGTPSSPSRPSIPGRKSKYSKPPETAQHPAFRRAYRIANLPPPGNEERINRNAEIRVGDDGVSYVIDGAPFEFKYSYTESPRVRPVKLREAPYSPFGPSDTPRPWTGRAPLPPRKKKLKEFDSFQLPPPNKKGVKPVQAPGPYLPGSGPRHVKTREEILGEPLTPEEVKDLVNGCLKSKRQLNMGRDGLTHNMLDNIHAHWKRRRVCKIKCKGVCTVDMENVCQQLEERTGGKIIYRKGGVVYLFRGRNYNFRTRPRFPLMLWKPVTPMYPRLIKRAPEGLTLEEAADMRKRGRKLIPICKLGKNGVYTNLVKHVKEAFEECELVRINCEGMNGSDYHKIGAKLKDLVPCVLVSFEREHILMWRGKDWKSSLRIPVNNGVEAMESSTDSATTYAQFIEDPETEMLSIKDASLSLQDIHTAVTASGEQGQDLSAQFIEDPETEMLSIKDANLSLQDIHTAVTASGEQGQDLSVIGDQEQDVVMDTISGAKENYQAKSSSEDGGNSAFNESENINIMHVGESLLDDATHVKEMTIASSLEYDTRQSSVESVEKLQDVSKSTDASRQPEKLPGPYADGVLQLRKQAIESGSALILVDGNLDADNVYQSAVAFARSAPPSPVFKHRPRKVAVQKLANEESVHPEAKELTPAIENGAKERKSSRPNRPKRLDELLDGMPQSQGTLRIDELAKLLA